MANKHQKTCAWPELNDGNLKIAEGELLALTRRSNQQETRPLALPNKFNY
jgi:hypothetical protein